MALDKHVEKVFLHEIKRQCDLALYAASQLQQDLRPGIKLWFYLHALLVAAGNLSKLLWSKRETSKGRCQSLRDTLGLDDQSPLQDVAMRNNYEHYDERIETWATESKHRNLVTDCIGPPGVFSIGDEPKDYHRIFDPASMTAWFWGESYPLRPAVEEIQRISEAVPTLFQKGGE